MSTGLGREDIRELLDDLSRELAARGARAELFLVGGAALAVAYDATRSTRDLDAVFVPSDVVRQAAAAVADREGLAEDWLNDAVKGSCPAPTRMRSASTQATR
jgi:methylmalonyl-CoA mutase cobalamin-binding subunit